MFRKEIVIEELDFVVIYSDILIWGERFRVEK